MIYLFLNLHLKTIVFLPKLKLQLPHAKLTLDGFWLLCLDSFDLLAPNILYFWLSKISVSVVTDDGKSRNTCCAHGIQFLCHAGFFKEALSLFIKAQGLLLFIPT
jgi:hypothetical protein